MEAEEGHVRLPRWVEKLHRDEKITDGQRRILYEIAAETKSWSRPWVRFTNDELAEKAGLSRRWAIELRDDLVNRGLLQQKEHGQSYIYGLGVPDQPSSEEIREIVQKQLQKG